MLVGKFKIICNLDKYIINLDFNEALLMKAEEKNWVNYFMFSGNLLQFLILNHSFIYKVSCNQLFAIVLPLIVDLFRFRILRSDRFRNRTAYLSTRKQHI